MVTQSNHITAPICNYFSLKISLVGMALRMSPRQHCKRYLATVLIIFVCRNKYWKKMQGQVLKKQLSRVERTLQEDIVPEMPAFCPGQIMVAKIRKSKAPR